MIRDLAKILLLINKPVELIIIPEDWEHLFRWADKALKRYRQMSDTSQVTQLMEFLQSPNYHNRTDSDLSRTNISMSTFKPDQQFGSSISLQDRKSNSNGSFEMMINPPINPQWQFNPPLGLKQSSSEFIPAQWRNSREMIGGPYVLEDDFYQLGFRPQDEITTEL